MAENKLEGNHQVFVVQQLACFARAKDVLDALKQNFGVEISLQAVCYYDISNPDLPKKLKTLFNSTRKDFLKDSSKIPISHKSVRLARLERMYVEEENQSPVIRNKKAMRQILEQAAKESGDAFSNNHKHELTGKDGKDLVPRTITVNVVKSNSIVKDETLEAGAD